METAPGTPPPRRARGFTLIEIVVVMFILGVAIAMAVAVTNALTASQRLSTTTTRMQTVDTAIVQFVMQQKRLPCPADGRLPSTDPNAGIERRDTTTGKCNVTGVLDTVQYGVVPWVTLGLAEADATDGWNHRLTYRLQPGLSAPSALDMSLCDPASTVTPIVATPACSPGCGASALGSCTPPAAFLLGKGLEVHNAAGTGVKIMDPNATPSTGAAYLVISAGSTGGGAYLSSGQVGSSTTTDGTEEARNYANNAIQTYYVDDSISDASGASHFDDIVSRPALLTVINKAGLGPRSHS